MCLSMFGVCSFEFFFVSVFWCCCCNIGQILSLLQLERCTTGMQTTLLDLVILQVSCFFVAHVCNLSPLYPLTAVQIEFVVSLGVL